jgi:hypothetical protein
MTSDLDEARACHAALKQIIDRHVGEGADYRALRRVLELCRRAGAAVEDDYCRDKLRKVEDFAAELFAPGEQRRWQFLKDQILGALELYASRIYSLEALRRSAARASVHNLQPLGT